MRILLLSLNHAPERTGIGKYQGEMATWLASRGHEVRAIAAPPYYPEWKVGEGYRSTRYKREVIDGVTVYRVPIYVPDKQTGLKRLLHLTSFVLSSKPILFWLAIFWKPEVVFMTAPPLLAAPLVSFASRLAGARRYLHIQDFEVDAAFHLGLLKTSWLYKAAIAFERFAIGSFSGISTISPNMRKKLVEKGVPSEKTFLLPNWANIEAFDPSLGAGSWRETFKKDPETVLVVYSGNLGCKQGLETIVDAARLLEGHKNIRFVVSGDGAGRAAMQDMARGLSTLTFLPVQSPKDFVHLMLAADIHLLPQKAGAADLVMPSKLGNILASGRPVVAGAAEGTQVYDAVQGCGLVVPPENAAAMAEAIVRLATDPVLRDAMGKRGRDHACAEWSKQSILGRLEAWIAGSPGKGERS